MGFASLKGFLLSLFGGRSTSVATKNEPAAKSCERRAEAPPRYSREVVIPLDAIDDVVAALRAPSASDQVDYLYLAAEAGRDAKAAAKAGNFDTAWGLFHDQKQIYLQYAQHQGWGARQTLALDSSVHEDLADLLRLEKRHREAFPHILYWSQPVGTDQSNATLKSCVRTSIAASLKTPPCTMWRCTFQVASLLPAIQPSRSKLSAGLP